MGLIPGQMIEIRNGNSKKVKLIPLEELSFGSDKKVKVKCDCCGFEKEIGYNTYNKNTKNQTEPYYCKNCSAIRRRETCIKIYGVDHPMKTQECKEKSKNTCRERYGYDFVLQTNEVRNKTKATCLERYGTEHPTQSQVVQDKIKATNLERYGVEYPSQNEEIKEKIKTTFMENYGVECALMAPSIKDKSRKTCIEKFGVECPLQSDIIRQKAKETYISKYGVEFPMQAEEIKNKAQQTCMEHFGVQYPTQSPEVQKKILSSLSQSAKIGSPEENEIVSIICKNFTDVKTSIPLDRCILDIEIEVNGIKINIECDGYYWHCNTLEDKIKDRNRDLYIRNNGYDKTLRIVYNYAIPSEEEILQAINELVNSDRQFKRIWSSDITEEQIEHFNNL